MKKKPVLNIDCIISSVNKWTHLEQNDQSLSTSTKNLTHHNTLELDKFEMDNSNEIINK